MNKNKTFISQIPKFQKNNYLIIYVHKYIFKIWSIISLVNHHVFMYFKGIRVFWADQYFVVVVESFQKTQQFFLLISLDIHTLDCPLFCLFLICLSHPFLTGQIFIMMYSGMLLSILSNCMIWGRKRKMFLVNFR